MSMKWVVIIPKINTFERLLLKFKEKGCKKSILNYNYTPDKMNSSSFKALFYIFLFIIKKLIIAPIIYPNIIEYKV